MICEIYTGGEQDLCRRHVGWACIGVSHGMLGLYLWGIRTSGLGRAEGGAPWIG